MILSRAIERSTYACSIAGRSVRPQWPCHRPRLNQATGLLRLALKPLVSAQRVSTRPSDAYVYPENVNIFDAGWAFSTAVGFSRIVAMVFAGWGILWAGPSVAISGTVPLYWLPVYALLPTLPMLASGFFFGGYVHHINVLLPKQARKSKEDLIRFANNIPPSTVLQLKSIWFRPWPITREVEFQDLRRLPASWTRSTNLEHQPSWGRKNTAFAERNPWLDWSIRSWMGRFFVRRRILKDRSRVSGVWNEMWKQIPYEGEKPRRQFEESDRVARRAGRMSATGPASARNRPSPARART